MLCVSRVRECAREVSRLGERERLELHRKRFYQTSLSGLPKRDVGSAPKMQLKVLAKAIEVSPCFCCQLNNRHWRLRGKKRSCFVKYAAFAKFGDIENCCVCTVISIWKIRKQKETTRKTDFLFFLLFLTLL